MPRPNGRFTYDATLQRFRNAGGQLIAAAAILPPAASQVSADDALELVHSATNALGSTTEHPAGAATPEWLRQMMGGLQQPCLTCGQSVGLTDVALSSTHTRDWGKAQ